MTIIFFENQNQPLISINSQGEIQKRDQYTKGFLGSLYRWFAQIIDPQNYNMTAVISKLFQDLEKQPINKENINTDIQYLCKKLAKKCKLDETLTNLFTFAPNSKLDNNSINTLTESLKANTARKMAEQFQKLLPKELPIAASIGSILQKTQTKARWTELGLSAELFDQDPAGASFLMKQRIAYTIIGYQQSTSEGMTRHEIKFNENSKELEILVEGNYQPVSTIKNLKYDADRLQLMDTSTTPHEGWMYISPSGLQKMDQYTTKDLQPVELLPPEDLEGLQNLAHKFVFPTQQETTPTKDNHPCVLQILTNPRKTLPVSSSLADRAEANILVHAGIVLVGADGKVYSTYFGATPEENEYRYSQGSRSRFATVNGLPVLLDYETFRPHEGRVTTNIPLTQDKFDEIIKDLNVMREKTVRFCLFKQNCTNLTTHVMNKAGVPLHTKIDLYANVGGFLPSISDIPVVGWVTKKIKDLTRVITRPLNLPDIDRVALLASNVFRSALLHVNILGNLLINSVIAAMGGTISSPMKDGSYASEDPNGLQPIHSVFPNWWSLLQGNSATFSHSTALIRWQLGQESTFVHPYKKKPSMSIVPLTNESDLKKADELKQKLSTMFHKGIFVDQESLKDRSNAELAIRPIF